MHILSVAQLNGYLKEVFETDELLQNVWIHGEVSNRSLSPAGHLYFTLKDGQSQIRCVAFRGQIARTGLRIPCNGDAVLAHGRVSIYEVQGVYQLAHDLLQPAGTGLLHRQFEELRARLEAEGLFDETRKRPLPAFPKIIGVVTSPTGAVIRDIISVLRRRYPLAELILAPATVQGDGAAASICQALRALNDWTDVDVIIVARGGGSLEELWPFNEESVARAIYASRVPVVSAIGHETDYTIADFVADLRAPTPSAAAELVSRDYRECQAQVRRWQERLVAIVLGQIQDNRHRLERVEASLKRASPGNALRQSRQRIDDLARMALRSVDSLLTLNRERISGLEMRLSALNPTAVLRRGYSICWHENTGRVVSQVAQVASGDALQVQVSDGVFGARAE